MNARGYYSRIINIGRQANPTFHEAQRDLAEVQKLTTLAQSRSSL